MQGSKHIFHALTFGKSQSVLVFFFLNNSMDHGTPHDIISRYKVQESMDSFSFAVKSCECEISKYFLCINLNIEHFALHAMRVYLVGFSLRVCTPTQTNYYHRCRSISSEQTQKHYPLSFPLVWRWPSQFNRKITVCEMKPHEFKVNERVHTHCKVEVDCKQVIFKMSTPTTNNKQQYKPYCIMVNVVK